MNLVTRIDKECKTKSHLSRHRESDVCSAHTLFLRWVTPVYIGTRSRSPCCVVGVSSGVTPTRQGQSKSTLSSVKSVTPSQCSLFPVGSGKGEPHLPGGVGGGPRGHTMGVVDDTLAVDTSKHPRWDRVPTGDDWTTKRPSPGQASLTVPRLFA